jgi:hypothetical protein
MREGGAFAPALHPFHIHIHSLRHSFPLLSPKFPRFYRRRTGGLPFGDYAFGEAQQHGMEGKEGISIEGI